MDLNWVWLGDHLALDVANTVRVSDGERVELLDSPDALTQWHTYEPQSLPGPTRFTERDLFGFRRLRDATLAVMHAAVLEEPLPGKESLAINEFARAARATRVLSGPGTGPVFECPAEVEPMTQLLGVCAAAVIDLVGRDDLANLAVCPAPDCGQFFHRARPNQRWCSPGCGNRARVDRHRHRRSTQR